MTTGVGDRAGVGAGVGAREGVAVGVSVGRGVWKDGAWYLVIARPRRTSDEADYQIPRGTDPGQFGIAIWNGSTGDVGSRKQYTDWIPFKVQP